MKASEMLPRIDKNANLPEKPLLFGVCAFDFNQKPFVDTDTFRRTRRV